MSGLRFDRLAGIQEAMRPLVLAFIGYNERLTRQFFGEFAMDNSEQIRKADFARGRIEFYDGTIIRRIDAGMTGRMDGWRFDQIIVADDYRMNARISRIDELQVLDCLCGCSKVPVEFRYIHYNIDAPEPKIHANVRYDTGQTHREVAVYGRFTF